jgi:hypothetical protein
VGAGDVAAFSQHQAYSEIGDSSGVPTLHIEDDDSPVCGSGKVYVL